MGQRQKMAGAGHHVVRPDASERNHPIEFAVNMVNRYSRIFETGPIPDCSGSPADQAGRDGSIHFGQEIGDLTTAGSHDTGYLRSEQIAATEERFRKHAGDSTPESKHSSDRTGRAAAAEQEHSVRTQKPGRLESDHPPEGRAADIRRVKHGDFRRQSGGVVGKAFGTAWLDPRNHGEVRKPRLLFSKESRIGAETRKEDDRTVGSAHLSAPEDASASAMRIR